jgi:ParB-like chromosome segregation protein Spo0J
MSNPVIQLVGVTDLVPYELNAKKHPQDQIEKLARTITKFGWTQPIVVWKGNVIIAGHGRRLAAMHLGLAKVPVIVRDDLTEAEADAMRLADNRVTSTDYDQEMIGVELQRLFALSDGDEDLFAAMGFDQKELDFTMADLGEISSDFFVDDVNAAVEEQNTKNERTIETTDETAAPLADALGFKRVSIAQSRAIRDLASQIEPVTGKDRIEGFIEVLKRGLEHSA